MDDPFTRKTQMAKDYFAQPIKEWIESGAISDDYGFSGTILQKLEGLLYQLTGKRDMQTGVEEMFNSNGITYSDV